MSLQETRTITRMSWCVILGLAAVGCSSGPPQQLLGPDPEPGQKYRNESKMTITNGTISVKDGDVTQTARVDLTFEGIEEEEILAVADKRITKSRIHVVSDKTKETVRENGPSTSRDEPSPLEGETIEFEKNGDD